MDLNKRRRRRLIKLIISETIMVVSVIVIVGVMLAVANGWRVGKDLTVEQNGLLQINSLPNGAKVVIDGEQLTMRTDTSKMLAAGEHEIKLMKEGYDEWSKRLKITSGLLTQLRYPRLFKQIRTVERVVRFDKLEMMTMSPDRQWVVYADGKDGEWWAVMAKDDEIKPTKIALGEAVVYDKKQKIKGRIDLRWENSGEWMIVESGEEGERHFGLVNVRQPRRSFSLNRRLEKLKLKRIVRVEMLGASGEKFLVGTQDGGLNYVNLVNGKISLITTGEVEDLMAEEEGVIYVRTNDKGRREVRVKKFEGDEVKLPMEAVKGRIRIAMSRYAGERFMMVAGEDRVMVYKNNDWPEERSESNLKLVLNEKMNLSGDMEVMMARNGELGLILLDGRSTVVDMENLAFYEFGYQGSKLRWLEDYSFVNVEEGGLVVRDFDGENRRVTVREGVLDLPIMITANSRWLYYLREDAGEKSLMRERL